MSKISTLLKIARVAGPALGVIKTQLPYIMKYVEKHPDAVDQVKGAVSKLAVSDRPRSQSAKFLRQVEALREQVDYLEKSADDYEERVEARRLHKQLDRVERSIRTLAGSEGKQRREGAKLIRKRLDDLTRIILLLFIDETLEDAETGDERGGLTAR